MSSIKNAPSQWEALRGWSRAIVNEYGAPNKMGAYEFARKEWGQAVAMWIWPRDEVLAEQVDLFGADADEVDDINRQYGAPPAENAANKLKSKLLR